MKKKYLFLFVTAMLSFSMLFACGKKNDVEEEAYVVSGDEVIIEDEELEEELASNGNKHPINKPIDWDDEVDGEWIPDEDIDYDEDDEEEDDEDVDDEDLDDEDMPEIEFIDDEEWDNLEEYEYDDDDFLEDDDEDWEDWEEEDEEDLDPVHSGGVELKDIYGKTMYTFYIPSGMAYYPEFSETNSYYNIIDDKEELDFYIENYLDDDYKEVYESGKFDDEDNGYYDLRVIDLGIEYDGQKVKALEFGYEDDDDGSFEYDFNLIIFPYKDSQGNKDYITVEFNCGAEEFGKSNYANLFHQLFK